jgi:hypothetical protein
VSWQNDHARTAPIPEGKKEVEDLNEIRREVETFIVESMDVPPKAEKPPLDQTWVHIGYIVVFGIIVAICGITLRFIVTGPFPFAFAAFGMGFVTIALFYGTIIDRKNVSAT